MKAIILAAGRGSRMKSLTDTQPKCFTILHNKRLIDWQQEALRSANIDQIGIVRGYLKDAFQYDATYFDNLRWSTTNMVTSLYAAREWLVQDTCIISYSDIVYTPQSINRLCQSKHDITITYDPNWLRLWKMRFDDPLSDAESFKINDASEVVEIGGIAQSVSEIEGQYMGLLKISPAGWTKIEYMLNELGQAILDKMDMTQLLNLLIKSSINVYAIPIDELWYEVDNENDLLCYQSLNKLF